MLNKLPVATKEDSIMNVVSRNTYTIAIIKELQGNEKYKIQILGSDKEYPNVMRMTPISLMQPMIESGSYGNTDAERNR